LPIYFQVILTYSIWPVQNQVKPEKRMNFSQGTVCTADLTLQILERISNITFKTLRILGKNRKFLKTNLLKKGTIIIKSRLWIY